MVEDDEAGVHAIGNPVLLDLPGDRGRGVAAVLGRALDVDAEMVSAYRTPDDLPSAREIIDTLSGEVPGLAHRAVQTGGAPELIETLPSDTLIVLGAPGGSWLQRAFFGPGARLRHRAPAGAVVVREAPARVYHVMGEPIYVSRHLLAGDALQIIQHPVVAVVDVGRLVGLVRRRRLEDTDRLARVGDVMDGPVHVEVGAPLADARAVADQLEGSPIPVIEGGRQLVGSVESID